MKAKGTLLVVDDERDFREDVVEALQVAGYHVLEAGAGEPAIELARKHTVHIGLLDLMMPGISGIQLMQELKHIDPLTQVVILTGQSSIESAVDAMRKGALDYLSKPVRLDELEVMIDHAFETAQLVRQNRAYRSAQGRSRRGNATKVIARSDAMRQIVREAEALGKMEMPVLIRGETGTGKEVVAELIHANSSRADMPLTVLDCGALPDNLVDAELFGHEKGTYTGADDARPGMIEVADSGTMFLDEIGDMPLGAQARLLRFLENGTIRRLGSRIEKTVDVRVIAATNRDLDEAIEAGAFRQDLYHRLRVYELQIPPLRDRAADILPLAQAALDAHCGFKARPLALTKSARDALHAYAWPGNVRELLHTVERAAFTTTLAGAVEIDAEQLRFPVSDDHLMDLESILKAAQNAHVKKVLTLTDGNRKEAAEILGVSERQMYRLLGEMDA